MCDTFSENTLNQSTQGFQNFSSVPVLHYLQADSRATLLQNIKNIFFPDDKLRYV
jgi:hypothetical protein